MKQKVSRVCSFAVHKLIVRCGVFATFPKSPLVVWYQRSTTSTSTVLTMPYCRVNNSKQQDQTPPKEHWKLLASLSNGISEFQNQHPQRLALFMLYYKE